MKNFKISKTLLEVAVKGAHARTGLASASGWARVPVSQTRPFVECHEPDFGRIYTYIYPSLAGESSSPRRTRGADSVRVWAPLV
jgi:hypothetical protein